MALQSQLVDIIFKEGADTKTGSPHVLASNLSKALNVRMDQTGVVSPRPAFIPYAVFSASTNFSGPAFEALSDEASLVTGSRGILWSTTPSRNIPLGTAPRGGLSRAYFGDIGSGISHIAASATQTCMVWSDVSQPGTPRLGISLSDAASGRVIYQSVVPLAATDGLQVVSLPAGFVIFTTSGHILRAFLLDLSQADTAFPFQIVGTGLVTATTRLRFAVCTAGTMTYVAYSVDSSADVKYQVLTYSAGIGFTVALDTTAFTLAGPAKGVSIAALSTGVATFAVGAANDGGSQAIRFFNTSGAPVGTTYTNTLSANATVQRVRFSTTPGNYVIFHVWGIDTVTQQGRTYKRLYDSTGSVSSSNNVTGLAPITGSIKIDSQDAALADSYTSPSYGSQGMIGDTNYLPILTSLGVGMNVGYQLSGELAQQLPNPVQVGNKVFYCLPVVTGTTAFSTNDTTTPDVIVETINTTFKTQASIMTWDLAYKGTSFIEKNNGQRIYVGTGTACLSAPFSAPGIWPEPLIKTADASVVSAGTQAAGLVSFVVAKKWVSADGAEYRTYSEIFTVNLSANKQLSVTVNQWDFNSLAYQTLGQTISMELYRTERGGIIFYLADSRTTAGTFSDTLTDGAGSTLIKQRPADINGNELPSTLIPSARLVTKYNDRLVLVPSDYPNKIYFEKPGQAPQGTVFASGLEVELNDEGGPITGIIQMDSALYIFKRNTILTLYGELPGATGENSTLTTPRILTNGLGCVDPRSVVLTPKGIVFKSEKGFELIARNQQLSFVGDGPYVDRTIQVVGTGIASNQPEVYFAHSNGDVWVLNLDNGGWYWWYCAEGLGGLTTANDLTFMAADVETLTMDSTVQADNIGTVPLPIVEDVATGWIKVSGIRGYQRARRLYVLGSVLTDCNVTVELYTDYSDTVVQTVTQPVTTVNPFNIDLHLQLQKCEAIKFRVRTNGYGITLAGATLEIGAKQGYDKSRTSGSNY